MDEIDCKNCGGNGLVKFFWLGSWLVGECQRCRGFGVDPDVLPKPRDQQSTPEKPDGR